MKYITVVAFTFLASSFLSGCSQKAPTKAPTKVVTKYVTKMVDMGKGKHCHTFKGYGWAKRVCHTHVSAHSHRVAKAKSRNTAKVCPTQCKPR